MTLSTLVALLFWLLALTCCAIGWRHGGRDGRAIAIIYLAACAATAVAFHLDPRWGSSHLPTFAVDAALLAGLLWIAARTRRYFPLWMTGLHLVAVISHLASALAPSFVPRVYFFIQGFWAVPMLVSFALGALLDHWSDVRDDDEPRSPAARYG